ncbi:hypothetical protein [Methanoculleus frigidifontis]|nr:hypothetical protein [Methanoculleus sp. FWC-SCC1]
MRPRMEQQAWEKYLAELRHTHSRKKRFLEILDRVEDRRIIERA